MMYRVCERCGCSLDCGEKQNALKYWEAATLFQRGTATHTQMTYIGEQ